MDKQSLADRKTSLEQKFKDLEAELHRVEGEHRLVVTLLDEIDELIKHEPAKARKVGDA